MILMNDFKSEPEQLKADMLAAVQRVISSGWYVLGDEGKAFEKRWARTCDTLHGVGVGNGLDAIEISLRALDIGKGDEVITTSMTAFATVLAIYRAGATPVLADIHPGTALMDLGSVKRCLSKKTKAIVLVHLYGQLDQMDEWLALCKQQSLHLIEDCAQAHLAKYRGKVAGSMGVAGAYSFYPTKNLGALGDAGMLVTNDNDLANRAARLRNYGQSERYLHPEVGMNSRLDEIQAAMLSVRLDWLEGFTEQRRKIAREYKEGLSNNQIKLLDFPEDEASHVYHLYVITSSRRKEMMNHLQEKGVQSLIHYPISIHHQKPCEQIQIDPQGLRNTERHSETCLSLPCHPAMTDAEVQQVISAVNSFK